MTQKTKRPADAASSGGPRGSNLINHDPALNSRPAIRPQATSLADAAGESDYAFFAARPGVNVRTRLPTENEFPPGVLEPGRNAFVRILIERDADGQPKRRARRRLLFCEGGHA